MADDTEKLIDLVHNYPYLYDTSHFHSFKLDSCHHIVKSLYQNENGVTNVYNTNGGTPNRPRKIARALLDTTDRGGQPAFCLTEPLK
jgi:hypothetical protein